MAELPEYYIIRKTHEGKAEITYECSKVKTNADRIRAMSDEKLASLFGSTCDCDNGCCFIHNKGVSCMNGCESAWLEWLKKEVE